MLQKFGFSQYESKVYETLVASEDPMDASTVVKHSGVPKAKIYEVLSRLSDKGLVSDSISDRKKRTWRCRCRSSSISCPRNSRIASFN